MGKELGVLSAYVAQLPDSKRSPNPIFSVAAVGQHAEFICGGGTGTAFGYDSAWDRLFQLNAEIVLLGCGMGSLTFVRYMEHRFGVPYLYHKLFGTPILDNGERLKVDVTALVRYMHCAAQYDLSRFEQRAREAGVLRETRLGGAFAQAINSHDCFAVGNAVLKEDIHFFLKEPPQYVSGQVPIT